MSSSYTNSSTQSGHNIDRKSLKRPDEFMKALNQFFDSLTKNYRAFLAVVLGIVALTAVIVFAMNRSEAKAEKGRNALFIAQKSLAKELKAMADAQVSAPAKDAKEADKEAALAKAIEAVMFSKMDVDAKLPQVVTQFKAVAQDYSGTRPGIEGQFALGNLYYTHGDAAKAAPWFQKAAEDARTALDKGAAYLALGHAHEEAGKLADAAKAYDQALSSGEPTLKGEALMSMGRVHELSKDLAKARAAYDQVISQLPATEYAKAAELRKSQLE